MPLCNNGRDHIAKAVNGEAPTAYDNANARLGVGDSSAAFAATQTDLQGSTNTFKKVMDASYPQRSGNVITYRTTFSGSEANFAWNEVALFNSATANTGMFNRKVSAQGTKTSGQSWELTLANTINNP